MKSFNDLFLLFVSLVAFGLKSADAKVIKISSNDVKESQTNLRKHQSGYGTHGAPRFHLSRKNIVVSLNGKQVATNLNSPPYPIAAAPTRHIEPSDSSPHRNHIHLNININKNHQPGGINSGLLGNTASYPTNNQPMGYPQNLENNNGNLQALANLLQNAQQQQQQQQQQNTLCVGNNQCMNQMPPNNQAFGYPANPLQNNNNLQALANILQNAQQQNTALPYPNIGATALPNNYPIVSQAPPIANQLQLFGNPTSQNVNQLSMAPANLPATSNPNCQQLQMQAPTVNGNCQQLQMQNAQSCCPCTSYCCSCGTTSTGAEGNVNQYPPVPGNNPSLQNLGAGQQYPAANVPSQTNLNQLSLNAGLNAGNNMASSPPVFGIPVQNTASNAPPMAMPNQIPLNLANISPQNAGTGGIGVINQGLGVVQPSQQSLPGQQNFPALGLPNSGLTQNNPGIIVLPVANLLQQQTTTASPTHPPIRATPGTMPPPAPTQIRPSVTHPLPNPQRIPATQKPRPYPQPPNEPQVVPPAPKPPSPTQGLRLFTQSQPAPQPTQGRRLTPQVNAPALATTRPSLTLKSPSQSAQVNADMSALSKEFAKAFRGALKEATKKRKKVKNQTKKKRKRKDKVHHKQVVHDGDAEEKEEEEDKVSAFVANKKDSDNFDKSLHHFKLLKKSGTPRHAKTPKIKSRNQRYKLDEKRKSFHKKDNHKQTTDGDTDRDNNHKHLRNISYKLLSKSKDKLKARIFGNEKAKTHKSLSNFRKPKHYKQISKFDDEDVDDFLTESEDVKTDDSSTPILSGYEDLIQK